MEVGAAVVAGARRPIAIAKGVESRLDRQLISAARVAEGTDDDVDVVDCAEVDDDIEVGVEALLDRRLISAARDVEGAGVEVDVVDCAGVDVEVDVEAVVGPGEAVGWGYMDVGVEQLPVAGHLDDVVDVLYKYVLVVN